MKNRSEREKLDQLLNAARKRIFFKTAATAFVSGSLFAVPIIAVAVPINQRWGHSTWNSLIILTVGATLLAYAVLRGFWGLGAKLRSALAIDEKAQLKDRVSSAYEFLAQDKLDEPRRTQVHDAIRHAESINSGKLFRFQWPKYSFCIPLEVLVLILSFLIPPAISTRNVAAVDAVKQLQMEQLKDLQEQLAFQQAPDKELKDVIEKLKDIQKRFEKGEISERDLMLQLARLDENLRQKANEPGVDNLEGEMNVIVPHLMSSAAALQVAAALKENDLEKANQELQQLSEKVKENKVSKDQKRELAMNMGVAASKLGRKSNASFGGDFAKASEALEKSDNDEFQSACNSMGDKLSLLKKSRTMKVASKKIGECKACLGQCNSSELGYALGPKSQGNKKGGLKAGTAASGEPLGEANRLEASYRQLLHVKGQAASGPVETETEVTEGQLSASQISIKELHANYAAVAEEAIENEAIPLSHRQHVKRYFQAIRPKE